MKHSTFSRENKKNDTSRTRPPTSGCGWLDDALDLEEAAQPPDLEDGLAGDDAEDEEVPPLDAGVGALGGVAVGTLAHDDVALLVLDGGEELAQLLYCKNKRRPMLISSDALLTEEALKGKGVGDLPSASRGSCGASDSET